MEKHVNTSWVIHHLVSSLQPWYDFRWVWFSVKYMVYLILFPFFVIMTFLPSICQVVVKLQALAQLYLKPPLCQLILSISFDVKLILLCGIDVRLSSGNFTAQSIVIRWSKVKDGHKNRRMQLEVTQSRQLKFLCGLRMRKLSWCYSVIWLN